MYENKNQKRDLIERTRAIAGFIGTDAASALESGDKTKLGSALEKIRGRMGIDTIYIFDANGDLFLAESNQPSTNNPYGWLSRRADFTQDALHLVEPFYKESQLLGSVYLRVPVKELNDRMKSYSMILISYMIAILSISIFLVFQIHKTISVPIHQLVKTIQEVPESVSFENDSPGPRGDEITDLYSGFNRMLRKIERRGAQRDRAETALQESERRYRNLVESSPDAIFIQKDNRIVFINTAGLKLLGISSSEEVTGKDIYSFLTKPSSENANNFETKLVRADGTACEVDVTIVEIMYEQARVIQGIVRDVTERKHLREMAERMKRLAAIGELSAHIAHEVRNSIASLQLNLQNLASHAQKPEVREKMIANMQTGIERMADTVTTILNFAKPNPPTMKRVPVQMVVESALKMTEKDLKDSNIQVSCNYDHSCPDLLMDPNQIQQAFLNLFRNSCEAMSEGGKVSVQTRLLDQFVEIEVADNGEGIPGKDIDRIFDPFFTTKRQGTGLGLAFVARTLEQHGASIFVESAERKGTKFFIRFPLNHRKIF